MNQAEALAALEKVAPGDPAIPEPAKLVPRKGQRARRRSLAA